MRGLDAVRGAPRLTRHARADRPPPATEERELLGRGTRPGSGSGRRIWAERPSPKTGAPNPDAQVTVMSARAAALVADGDDPDGWAQAGDQLYVDYDLSEANLPAGSGSRSATRCSK